MANEVKDQKVTNLDELKEKAKEKAKARQEQEAQKPKAEKKPKTEKPKVEKKSNPKNTPEYNAAWGKVVTNLNSRLESDLAINRGQDRDALLRVLPGS